MRARIFFTSLGIFFAFAGSAAALQLEIDYPSLIPVKDITTLPELTKILFQFSLAIGALLLFGVLLWGGVLFLLSAGSPPKQQQAKRRLQEAFLGTLLLFGAFLAIQIFAPELSILKDVGLDKISLPKKDEAASKIAKGTQCSDGVDNDRDGKTDGSDPDCPRTDGLTEFGLIEYECVETSKTTAEQIPEVTENYPLVTRAKQARETLNAIAGTTNMQALFRQIYDDAKFVVDNFSATSRCSISKEDHEKTDSECGDCGRCPVDPGLLFPGHFHCTDWPHCHRWDCVEFSEGGGCIRSVCGDERWHHTKTFHGWHCHYAAGAGLTDPPHYNIISREPARANDFLPRITPPIPRSFEGVVDAIDLTITSLTDAINTIDHETDKGAKDIEWTLRSLISQECADGLDNDTDGKIDKEDADCKNKNCEGNNECKKLNTVENAPLEIKNALLPLRTVAYEIFRIRDRMPVCARTPKQSVETCNNVVTRGAEVACEDDYDFVCLFTPESRAALKKGNLANLFPVASADTICIPKTPTLEYRLDKCPDSPPGGTCDRIRIGEESTWNRLDLEKPEFQDILDGIVTKDIPPVVKALKDLRQVAQNLVSNCKYSMDKPGDPPGSNSGHSRFHAVACQEQIFHPIYKDPTTGVLLDPMGSEKPENTIKLLQERKDAITNSAVAGKADVFRPGLGVNHRTFSGFYSLLSASLLKLARWIDDPLEYVLACGELVTIRNSDGSRVRIEKVAWDPKPLEPRKPGFCGAWDWIAVFSIHPPEPEEEFFGL